MNLRHGLVVLLLVGLTAACAPGTTAPSSAPSPSTSAPDDPADDGRALIAMSIHVEGWLQEADQEVQFQAHVEVLLELASVASAHGAVLTFELSPVFTEAVTNWDSDILEQLVSMGHELAIHADVGGRGTPTLAELVAQLEAQVVLLEATGYSTKHVSGVCSRGPWVEAAYAAGFTSVAGGVEYCLTSLDPEYVPDGYEWTAGCATPSVCHGPVPVPAEQAATGWWANSSSDWIVDRSAGDVLILTGPLEGQVECFKHNSPGACPTQSSDIATIDGIIDQYAEIAASADTTTVLPLTDSVGGAPAEGFSEALFSAIEERVEDGTVEWSGLPSAAADLGA